MKKYIKPETLVISARPTAILAGSPREGHEIGNDDGDAYAKRNDLFDLVDVANEERENSWPEYSAWDE